MTKIGLFPDKIDVNLAREGAFLAKSEPNPANSGIVSIEKHSKQAPIGGISLQEQTK